MSNISSGIQYFNCKIDLYSTCYLVLTVLVQAYWKRKSHRQTRAQRRRNVQLHFLPGSTLGSTPSIHLPKTIYCYMYMQFRHIVHTSRTQHLVFFRGCGKRLESVHSCTSTEYRIYLVQFPPNTHLVTDRAVTSTLYQSKPQLLSELQRGWLGFCDLRISYD